LGNLPEPLAYVKYATRPFYSPELSLKSEIKGQLVGDWLFPPSEMEKTILPARRDRRIGFAYRRKG